MRLAISNIAWEVEDDEAVAALLQRLRIDAIDIAPSKYFPVPARASRQDMARVRDWWAARGVEITGMQALLFGTTGLNLFGAEPVRNAMLEHLAAVCRIAGGIGARRLVFGSPKNRDRSGLGDAQTQRLAIDFFRALGDIAQTQDVLICLEPNPVSYGANFLTTTLETVAMVEQVDHPAIRLQLDTGTLTLNGEDPDALLHRCAASIGHVHASEPNLLPLGDGGCDHARVAAALARHLPQSLVSVEMLATRDEPHLTAIERALAVARAHYRQGAGETDV